MGDNVLSDEPSISGGIDINQQAASYIIYQDNSKTKAKNNQTGTIEYSSTDAATVFQAVLNKAIGKRVSIKSGTYTINTQITIPSTGHIGMMIEGEAGRQTTIIQCGANITSLIKLSTASFSKNIVIKNITFKLNGKTVTTLVDLSQGNSAQRFEIANCEFDTNTGTATYCLDLSGNEDSITYHCLMEGTAPVKWSVPYGALVDYNSQMFSGIAIACQTANFFGTVFSRGITVIGSAGQYGQVAYLYGVYANDYAEAFFVNNAGGDFQISLFGGFLHRSSTTPFFAGTNAVLVVTDQTYFISIDASACPILSVAGSKLESVRRLNRINGVPDPTGYYREKAATATILSGQTSVTFAHGLVATPSAVLLGATHAEVADAIWSADATNITITVPSAVTANRNISWQAIT